MFTVGQFARICNVSTKTLRHYDEVGQIKLMRRILFLRDLDVNLDTIGRLIESGALEDSARLEAILSEQASTVAAEIEARAGLLSRLQTTVAAIRREGEVPSMTEQPVVIKEVPAVQVVGVRKTMAIKDIGRLFPEVGRKLRSRPAGPPMTLYYDQDFDPEHADIEVVFPVTARGERTLPGATVASIVYVGPYEAISPVYAKLFAWVNENKRRIVGPPRDIYLVGPGEGKSLEEYVTEVQVPIE
ncbi:MAG TPA: GyrI-like domain-containing protein [Bacillota bacterium]|jgi:effector-binding domain-containing protein/DNA-binding transcriptional MerR regulator